MVREEKEIRPFPRGQAQKFLPGAAVYQFRRYRALLDRAISIRCGDVCFSHSFYPPVCVSAEYRNVDKRGRIAGFHHVDGVVRVRDSEFFLHLCAFLSDRELGLNSIVGDEFDYCHNLVFRDVHIRVGAVYADAKGGPDYFRDCQGVAGLHVRGRHSEGGDGRTEVLPRHISSIKTAQPHIHTTALRNFF